MGSISSPMNVLVEASSTYHPESLDTVLGGWDHLFGDNIRPGNLVVVKPNWIAPGNKYKPEEWEAVITHPALITAVLRMVLKHLRGEGRVVITDGPQTQSSWEAIMARMTPELWKDMGRRAGVAVDILDLREDEWQTQRDVIVARKKLPGDPLGSTECDLHRFSEFVSHRPGPRGYFGADYDRDETNTAHSNGCHKYRLSRTVISADVFINLPKLKTHKKAGITASLKNLVGINTYKNWLPHHTEGTPDENGDQFPAKSLRTAAEGRALEGVRHVLTAHAGLGRLVGPLKSVSKAVFGDTRDVIRNGSWYGNDTIWRMILDLNKILAYADPDGLLRPDRPESRKRYLSIVDAVVAGEGNGPEAPDPKITGVLIAGTNPVAVDAVCSRLMGFDWQKIPSLKNAFAISTYRLCEFAYDDIRVSSKALNLNAALTDITFEGVPFRPHFGWKDHIEFVEYQSS